MKTIILLNGPSSSGKSSLSKALQRLFKSHNQIYEIVDIDDFMKIGTDEKIYEDDVFEISMDMNTATKEYLNTSDGVIVDHVITSERIYQQFLDMFKEYKVIKVHISCPIDVLLSREQARGNRNKGTANDSYTYLYPKKGYDITIDTSKLSIEEAALNLYKVIPYVR